MQSCKKCGVVKFLHEFPNASKSRAVPLEKRTSWYDEKKSVQTTCRECNLSQKRARYREDPEPQRARSRGWKADNPDKVLRYSRKWYEENREKAIDSSSKWRLQNLDRAKAYRKKYYLINKDEELRRNSEWRRSNKDKHREMSRQWIERNRGRRRDTQRKCYHRNKSSEKIRAKIAVRRMLNNSLRNSGGRKLGSTHSVLGYSTEKLMQRMECQFTSGMSWSNHGEWHIDHKIPVDHFVSKGETRPRIVNCLCNLQPLWAADNLLKSNTHPLIHRS